jgi:hypothetical protein
MRNHGSRLRLVLLAGASALALVAAAENVAAADHSVRMPKKAPPAVVNDTFTWWVEGGGFGTGGSAIQTGVPGVGGFRPNWGWEGAFGFDWKAQAFAPWHVSAQFRYGKATKKSKPFSVATAGTVAGGTTTYFGTASGSQDLRDDHWLVDFAVGREFGLGTTKAQWKLGVRVADLRSKLNVNGSFVGSTCTAFFGCSPAAGVGTGEQKSKFFGVGPRLGVEGETPLGGSWTFDWLAGAAVLFGKRSLDRTVSWSGGTISGSLNQSFSDRVAVFNADAQAGLSYWFNPNVKLTASYRFDGYFNALKTFGSTGNVLVTSGGGAVVTSSIVNIDRFYHGPMLRLTATY